MVKDVSVSVCVCVFVNLQSIANNAFLKCNENEKKNSTKYNTIQFSFSKNIKTKSLSNCCERF